MTIIIEKRYQSFEHLDYPKMEQLIDQVMWNPQEKFTIPEEFLLTKDKCPTYLGLFIHKIKVFVKSFWINIKMTFNKSYRKNYEFAVKKIIETYEKASCIKKTVQEIIPNDTQDNQTKRLHEQPGSPQTLMIRGLDLYNPLPRKNQQNLQLNCLDLANRTDFTGILHEQQVLEDSIKQEKPETDNKIDQKETEQHTQSEPQKELPTVASPLIQEKPSSSPQSLLSPQVQQKEPQKLVKEVEKITKIKVEIKKKTPFEVMNETIKEMTCNEKLSELWQILWSNDKNIEKNVKSWAHGSFGDFTIRLHEPLRLWINTPSQKGGCVKGGCVFIFDKEILGSLGENKIIFQQGFSSLCYVKFPLLGDKPIEAKMNSIHYVSDKKITTNGTWMKMSKDNNSSYETMKNEWSNKVTVIPDSFKGGHEEFLEKKYNG